MRMPTFVSLVLLGCLVVAAGCVDGRYGYDRGRRGFYRADPAWEIVRNDPCRYEEYRRFAERHKNAEKRRHFVETLAREGCGRDRADPYRNDPYRDDPYSSDPD
jgi:hypothetical protein